VRLIKNSSRSKALNAQSNLNDYPVLPADVIILPGITGWVEAVRKSVLLQGTPNLLNMESTVE
jgi:hypothetical protein